MVVFIVGIVLTVIFLLLALRFHYEANRRKQEWCTAPAIVCLVISGMLIFCDMCAAFMVMGDLLC